MLAQLHARPRLILTVVSHQVFTLCSILTLSPV